MLLFVYTTTHKGFVIFTCRYFKLSWNTIAPSQSNCRNFSCSSNCVIPGSLLTDNCRIPLDFTVNICKFLNFQSISFVYCCLALPKRCKLWGGTSLRGRRSKGKGIRARDHEGGGRAPRLSLAPKTPFPFPFKRLPRRLRRHEFGACFLQTLPFLLRCGESTDQNRTNWMREDNVRPKVCYGTLVLMTESHFRKTNLSWMIQERVTNLP